MEPSVPPQKSAFAAEFLAFLGRGNFEFRCFADLEQEKQRALPQRLIGAFDNHKTALRQLNDLGYGIFVQVNEGDGHGNKTANIIRAPTFFVDLDGTPLENVSRLELIPHRVVNSSPGKFHAYWRVNDIPISEYKSIQKRLAKLIGSDPAVCDLPRVMRLPGFLHQKDPDNPFLVSPGSVGEHDPYSFDAFLSALVRAENARAPKPTSRAQLNPREAKSGLIRDLERAKSAIDYLISNERLNLGEYHDWFRLAAAIKHTYQENGWTTFHEISAASPGYKDEENCRRQWDAIDEPSDGNPLTIATYIAEAKQAGWSPSPNANFDSGRRASAGEGEREHGGRTNGRFGRGHDPAAVSIELAEEAGDEFWLDQHDKAHATYRVSMPGGEEVCRHAPISGATYGGVLRRRYYEGAGKVLHKEAVANAAGLLEYKAEESGIRHQTSLRVAEHDGFVYVDLGQPDGSTFEIGPAGRRLVTNPPVRFLRGSRGALPAPEPGGKLADFEHHFNLSPTDVIRTVAFMVGTFNTSGSCPILFFVGEQAFGKSMMADMGVALTDPPNGMKSARFSFTRDEKDLHVSAKGARVLCFDNISNISAPEADALCRMATGAASSSRKLYTDDEEARMVVQRPVIATSIGVPSSRADLLSRSIVVRALPVKVRRTEKALMRGFEADRPKLLGFLLDCVSAAIRNAAEIEQAVEAGQIKLPRMGDFAQFVEGASELLGLTRGEFSKLIESDQNDLQAEAAQTHKIGSALIEYFSRRNAEQIGGPARDVLTILRAYSPDERIWPAANKLRNELTRIAEGLRKLGIEFETNEPGGRDHVMSFRIWKTAAFRFPDDGADDAF